MAATESNNPFCAGQGVLGALYLTLFVQLGLASFRKGHYLLFFVGIVFPVLWIIGALLGPTQSAQAAGVR